MLERIEKIFKHTDIDTLHQEEFQSIKYSNFLCIIFFSILGGGGSDIISRENTEDREDTENIEDNSHEQDYNL